MTLPLPRALLPRTLQVGSHDFIYASPFVARRQAQDGGFLACVGGNRHALGIGIQGNNNAHHANEIARGERECRQTIGATSEPKEVSP